jgi:uncharacterized repeat protein (TIGR02543 family)
MIGWRYLLVLLFLVLGASVTPAKAQSTYDCGNLGQRACGGGDFEYGNMFASRSRPCEMDLRKSDGTCVNDNRITTVRRQDWAGWALENQTFQIGKDAPINFITWPTSHNAYSSSRQGFEDLGYTNQGLSITDQLNLGARALELDPKYFNQFLGIIPVAQDAVRVCHAGSVVPCLFSGYGNRLFGFVLTEIAQWIDRNPGQVIYIKLDTIDLGNQVSRVYDEVERYLGHRVYRAPSGGASRWPTLQEIRNAGKSVIIVRHNADGNGVSTTWVWGASGNFQSSNWPKNQNFDSCTAHDGHTPITRGRQAPFTWWDTAEGRSGYNRSSKDTGLYWEDNVAKAAKCGVAQIGLDFIGTLDSTWALDYSRRSGPDNRFPAMIWSWAEGDWGRNGPASFNPELGRWQSRTASTALRLVCAAKRSYGSTEQDRQWRITAAAYPWNVALANDRCAQEFGANFEFGAPENGFQNSQLKLAVTGTDNVWLNYTAVSAPRVILSTNELTFRMDPNTGASNTQMVHIAAAPGTTTDGVVIQSPFPIVANLPANALATGTYSLAVSIPPSVASALGSGEYEATLIPRVSGLRSDDVVKVRLIIKAAPTVSVTVDRSTVRQDELVTITARLTGALNPTGKIGVFNTINAQGTPLENRELAAVPANSTGVFRFDLRNLPLGTNTYSVQFFGDGRNLGDVSEPFQITATPRIIATPSSLSFRTPAGSVPAPQTVTFSGQSGQVKSLIQGCTYVERSESGAQAQVIPRSSIATLAPGTYSCFMTAEDGLTPNVEAATVVPITITVEVSLSTMPSGGVNLSSQSPTADVQVLSSTAVPFQVTTKTPWIIVEQLSAQTPGTFRILASEGSLPNGTHNGSVTISSTAAASITLPVTFRKIAPTTFNTNVAGAAYSVNGVSYLGPQTFYFEPGVTVQLGASGRVSREFNYRFVRWVSSQGISTTANVQTTPISANGDQFTAEFETWFPIIITPSPSQGGTVEVLNPTRDGFYPAGSVVELRAVPATGYTFVGWGRDATGTNPQAKVTMSDQRFVTATFSQVQPVAVDITANVAGAIVTINGVATPLPAKVQWVPGQQYTLVAADQLPSGNRGEQWVFTSWSNGGANGQSVKAPSQPLALSVTYRQQFFLTASASPQNGGTVEGSGWYDAGSTATLVAKPNPNFTFSGFSGGVTSSSPSIAVPMTAPVTVAANFSPVTTGSPVLTLASGGARVDGPMPGQRIVPIALRNSGTGMAVNARITNVGFIGVQTGTGVVTPATATPVLFGNIEAGKLSTQNLVFQWPSTATRVSITFTFTADGVAEQKMTLSLTR